VSTAGSDGSSGVPIRPPTTPPPASRAQIARGVAWSGAAQAIIAIADLISQLLVLALWVPLHDYGVAVFALGFYSALDTAADLGVTSALIQKDDHTEAKVSTVFWFNLLISTALLLVLLVAGPLYGHAVGYPVVGLLLIAYGGKLLLQNAYTIPLALLRKQLRFDEVAKGRVLAHVAESVARIVFAAAGLTIWCFTLAALVRTVVFAGFIQWRNPFVPSRIFRPREVVDYIKFGLRSGASGLLYQVYANLDYTVVGSAFGAAALGAYRLAYEIVLEPVRSITNVVSDVAFPTFARLRHVPERLVDQFTRFVRLNFTTVLPFLVLIALLVDDFLRLFPSQSAADLALTADCCRILCFVGILRAVGFLGPPLLDGVGRPDLTLRYMVITAVWMPTAFVLGAWLLGGELGARAVALAWAVGYPLTFVVLAGLILSTTSLRLRSLVRDTGGMMMCSMAGLAVGAAVRLLTPDLHPGLRVVAVAVPAVATIVILMVTWQKLTPASIKASMKAD
jgi:O-antigen/teichoic acid export membrane protein